MKKTNSDEKLVEAYTPRDPGLISRFLATKPYKQRTLDKSFPGYKSALFFKAVEEVSKRHTVRALFGMYYGSVVSPKYSYLEVGRNKKEELLVVGTRFIIKNNSPLSVYVSPGWGTVDLCIDYNKKDSSVAISFLKEIEDYMTDNNFYKNEKISATGEFLPLQSLDFENVKLPDIQKQAIKIGALDFFKKKDIYLKNNLPFKRGLIFTGTQGTGKTLTGKILMSKSDCTFIWVTASMVSAAEDVKSLFRMARELAPSILFMEDLDDYLEFSGAVDVFKTQMDGMDSVDGICTILCTNFPDRLPKALIDRPSRFDDVILFQLPDLDLRYQILLSIAEPMSIDNKESILKEVAEKTKGLTGAHLKEILIYSLLVSADSGRGNINADDIAIALLKVQDTKDTVTDGLYNIDVKALLTEIKTK